jgi:hypothetical protein
VIQHGQETVFAPSRNRRQRWAQEPPAANAGPPTVYLETGISPELEAFDVKARRLKLGHDPPPRTA